MKRIRLPLLFCIVALLSLCMVACDSSTPYIGENGNWYIVQEHDASDLSAYIEAEKEEFRSAVASYENVYPSCVLTMTLYPLTYEGLFLLNVFSQLKQIISFPETISYMSPAFAGQ